jgi:hypothetical protein
MCAVLMPAGVNPIAVKYTMYQVRIINGLMWLGVRVVNGDSLLLELRVLRDVSHNVPCRQ